MTTLVLLAIVALLVSTAAIWMALSSQVPARWLYYHYHVRKPVVWAIFGGALLWVVWQTLASGTFRPAAAVPLGLMALAVVLAHRMHQEIVFRAVDFPASANDPLQLPLTEEMQLAVIDYGGVAKAYPLDYVIHHHIVNDRFGERIVSLTYCAMCRSIIPFDVTDIGPLFVGSFKQANMIVADRGTKTFFQQASFQSIIGPLHPRTLTMIPFQILPWRVVKRLEARPQVVQIVPEDLREFRLPIPGVWKKIMASEVTPGLPSSRRDASFPARTRVIGLIDPIAEPQVAYLKEEVIRQGIVKHESLNAFLVAQGDTVSAFRGIVAAQPITLVRQPDGSLADSHSGTRWDARGKYLRGPLHSDLALLAISDEYWFSWKFFHPTSQLIRLA